MNIVYQKDGRSGITYAYENRRIWSEERKKYVNQRKLIGRVVNLDTKEIAPTDGRCRRRSPYLTDEEKARIRVESPPEFGPALTKGPSTPDAMHNGNVCSPNKDVMNDDFHMLLESIRHITTAIEKIKDDLESLKQVISSSIVPHLSPDDEGQLKNQVLK